MNGAAIALVAPAGGAFHRTARRATLALLAALLAPAIGGAQPYVLATRPGNGEVVAIDASGGGASTTLPGGAMPAGAALSPTGTRLYVADASSGLLRVLDPASGPLTSIAVGDGPTGVALCDGGGRVAVALAQEDAVAIVDTASLAVLATLPVGDRPMAVACAEGSLAVASYGAATVSVFDATTLASLGTVAVGAFPAGIAIGGGRAWVTSLFDSTVTVVALPAVTVSGTITVGSAPRGIAVGGGRVFVANVNDATLSVIDPLTASVIATVPLPTPGPTEVQVHRDVFVAHLGEPAVTVVSPATLAVTTTLEAPTGLLAIAGVTEEGGAPAAEVPALGPLGIVVLAAALAFLATRRRTGTTASVAFALLLALGGDRARAAIVTYSDSTFTLASWEVFSATSTSHNETNPDFAGNPAPSRAMVHFQAPNETVAVVHRWLDASYEPSTAGAVTGLSVSWDRISIGPDCALGGLSEAFVVFQGGVAYRGPSETFSSDSWEGTGTHSLTADQLSDGAGGTPDFSSNGGALTFGFWRESVSGQDPPPLVCHGIDNLIVGVQNAEPEPTHPSLLGFSALDHFVLAGDDLVVGVRRTGDLTLAASVEVLISPPGTTSATGQVSWPAGTGGEASVAFANAALVGNVPPVVAIPMQLVNASAQAEVDSQRRRAMVYLGNEDLSLLLAALALLLARWEPAGLLVLVAIAAYAVWRRRRHHGGSGKPHVACWFVLLPALMASSGCVASDGATFSFDSTSFNDRISADLQGLSPQEIAVDRGYGSFSDGSGDPDGDGPRRGGLVSEIVPVSVTNPKGSENLILTQCLFVGRGLSGGDQLKLAWEVVGDVDRSSSDYLRDAFIEGYEKIGFCTYSNPLSRLLFENPDPNVARPDPEEFARQCKYRDAGSIALTVPDDPEDLTRNVPLTCPVGGNQVTKLDQFELPDQNPDSLCPDEHFVPEVSTDVPATGCMRSDGYLPACALPCGHEPATDGRYRVRVASDVPIDLPVAERWLSPDVLVVDSTRTVVRQMERSGSATSLSFAWHTFVEAPGGAEAPVRWAENYSPTVRVDTVQIISRDPTGSGERVERPTNDRLVVEIPRPGQSVPTILECTGADGDEGFEFAIGDCAAASDEPDVLDALTPTYLVSNLAAATNPDDDPALKQPITWRATLDRLEPNERQVFVKLWLRAQTMGAALRVSAALDFGSVPDTDYRQDEVELENVGGETVAVTGLGLLPGVGHPQDFTVFAVGDPVPMPLPIDAQPSPKGGVRLSLGDLGEAPLLSIVENGDAVDVQVGDPAAAPGDLQPFTLYGQAATLRGGVLTRDDPGAAFLAPAGTVRPFVVPAYVESTPPFALRPGERRRIVVEARPSAHGVRRAELVVRYASAANPQQTAQVRSQLQVEVVSGPLLRHAPASLFVDRDANGAQPGQRTAMIFNAGHADLTVHGFQLVGRDASRFAATTNRGLGPFVLRPSDYVDVMVEYLPECDGSYGTPISALDHEATLVVSSDGGTVRIGLGGSSRGFCE